MTALLGFTKILAAMDPIILAVLIVVPIVVIVKIVLIARYIRGKGGDR